MPRRFDEDRRNKYARSAQATQRRTTTYDALGELLQSHLLTLRSDLDPIDDYCNEHGLPPLAVVCVDRKTGEPSRGNVGVFRLDKNRERVFNYDWFALVPPTPTILGWVNSTSAISLIFTSAVTRVSCRRSTLSHR